ncbi:hypothetical protein CONPUDRAFT_151556 [Coniophora puteana RWD-64-598 SS2]|uniref:F-box domain-containing protein n=1 Tax=Coniophora puteana (strain RWD-64-598) TaxID=741705 RepID=A0A5M3MZG5_CONPW|nr:uncharacterized protein CONPUDRAFT_151556 [Coniophora puteana RWD-64-598 SS2]EIW84540.1 hypothetical protein CONPUDRAFT_151556 [Coniophora puteana RWD-64-598 SS2]
MALQQLVNILPHAVTEALQKAADSPYSSYGNTNGSASLADIGTVFKIVEDLSALICTLDAAVAMLTSCKVHLVQSRADHSRFVSALWRLPVEIMAEIFQLSVPHQIRRGAILDGLRGRGPALNVAQVCRHWRSVALATPSLWEVVRIRVPVKIYSSDVMDSIDLYESELELLSRGSPAPFYLVSTVNMEGLRFAPKANSIPIPCNDTSFVERLESCWGLDVGSVVFSTYKPMFAAMKNLRRLMTMTSGLNSFDVSPYPLLTHLSMHVSYTSRTMLSDWFSSVRCYHLTTLIMLVGAREDDSQFEVDITRLVQSFPRLEHLYMEIPGLELTPPNVAFSHPTLKTLSIACTNGPDTAYELSTLGSLFALATFPSLSELILHDESAFTVYFTPYRTGMENQHDR